MALLTLCAAAPVAALLWWLTSENEPLPPTATAYSQVATSAYKEPAPEAEEAPDTPNATPAAAPSTGIEPRDEASDIAARNAGVDVRSLTTTRPNAARTFLDEVQLAKSAQGGYVVAEVLPESRYERLGLRPGDVIYSLDTPKMAAVDESSMIALMQQTELELDVYRNGSLTRLTYNYAKPEGGDRDAKP
ncbi:MAG TPA: hypothetical protein VHQ87_08120 [Rhizobacter sp.]|nr:hypothetical protein [Rhizobacter sp.]